ncbi:MAG: hypothetical protein M9884_07135 [Rhodocyclaceae bacterium]|nr:hypothetical protein [Rhodocyclaceae bacterium]
MKPEALLAVFRQITGGDPPPAWLLTVRGESFELGEPLSPIARGNLEAALAMSSRCSAVPGLIRTDPSRRAINRLPVNIPSNSIREVEGFIDSCLLNICKPLFMNGIICLLNRHAS